MGPETCHRSHHDIHKNQVFRDNPRLIAGVWAAESVVFNAENAELELGDKFRARARYDDSRTESVGFGNFYLVKTKTREGRDRREPCKGFSNPS